MKNKFNWNINKYIFVVFLTLLSPMIVSFLLGESSGPSTEERTSSPVSRKPNSALKSQIIFLNSRLNEVVVFMELQKQSIEKGNKTTFHWNHVVSHRSELGFFAVSIGILLLLYLSFISYNQIIISYIHRMDGKKDRLFFLQTEAA